METARNLNMETDEMQLVVSALRGVGKRIVEVAQTHKPLFAGEFFGLMVKCTPIIVELSSVYRGCKPLICFQ